MWEPKNEYFDGAGRTGYLSAGFFNRGDLLHALFLPWENRCSIISVDAHQDEPVSISFTANSIEDCDKILPSFAMDKEQLPKFIDYYRR